MQSKGSVLDINAETCTGRFRDTAVVLYVQKDDEGATARKYFETTLGRKWGAATTAVGYMARIRELRDRVRRDLTDPTVW